MDGPSLHTRQWRTRADRMRRVQACNTRRPRCVGRRAAHSRLQVRSLTHSLGHSSLSRSHAQPNQTGQLRSDPTIAACSSVRLQPLRAAVSVYGITQAELRSLCRTCRLCRLPAFPPVLSCRALSFGVSAKAHRCTAHVIAVIQTATC